MGGEGRVRDGVEMFFHFAPKDADRKDKRVCDRSSRRSVCLLRLPVCLTVAQDATASSSEAPVKV